MEGRRDVEFVGGSSLATLVGSASTALAGGGATRQGGNGRTPHLAGLAVERRVRERSGVERDVQELILFF